MSFLIKKCICGGTDFIELSKNNIPLFECVDCAVLHQKVELNLDEYKLFYKNEYHENYQKTLGRQSYSERYNHDVSVAKYRLDSKYKHLPKNCKILDIGSGNGAFIDYANFIGYKAEGIDFIQHPNTHVGSVEDVLPTLNKYDVITLHDVLEHLVDPANILNIIKEKLNPSGQVIIDFPDYYKKSGIHHWRPIQHLWYMNEKQLISFIESYGFITFNVEYPIPGKLLIYGRI